MVKSIPLLFFFALIGTLLAAQRELPSDFQARLDQAGLSFIYPLDAGYKSRRNAPSPYFESHYTLRSRKEKMEIRYHIQPFDANDPTADLPHINASRLLLHLASNDGDKLMSGINLSEEVLQEDYQADWGKLFNFQPKSGFSRYQHCQMLALFLEGKGMAYVLFLFDDAPPTLEYRKQALEFIDSEENLN